jgi:hypothetical protein
MNSDKFKLKLDQGDQHLEAAQNELFRSAEDVVPHMACSSARKSIFNYLHGFLLQHGIEQNEIISLESLLKKCSEIDPKFKAFDLSKMACRTEASDEHYCTEVHTVEYCIGLATQAKKLVKETKPTDQKHWPESRPIHSCKRYSLKKIRRLI